MSEPHWEKVHEDDLLRCQGVTPQGQCYNKAVEHSQFCPAHGGNRGAQTQQKKEMRNYRLAKFKNRLIELGENEQVMNLRDEIAILRVIIEEKWNQAGDAHELMLMSGPLGDLIMKVEKLVSSANRLESKLGGLLDRAKVVQFANSIVQVIGKYVTDENQLDAISEEILKSLQEVERGD
jgi:hypothetical protein